MIALLLVLSEYGVAVTGQSESSLDEQPVVEQERVHVHDDSYTDYCSVAVGSYIRHAVTLSAPVVVQMYPTTRQLLLVTPRGDISSEAQVSTINYVSDGTHRIRERFMLLIRLIRNQL